MSKANYIYGCFRKLHYHCKNVSSLVCKRCGETSYTDEVAQELEKIVVSMKKSLTEIAVVNFHKVA